MCQGIGEMYWLQRTGHLTGPVHLNEIMMKIMVFCLAVVIIFDKSSTTEA